MKCSSCLQDIWTIAIEWDNSWAMYCVNCLNNKAAKEEVVYFKWKYYVSVSQFYRYYWVVLIKIGFLIGIKYSYAKVFWIRNNAN